MASKKAPQAKAGAVKKPAKVVAEKQPAKKAASSKKASSRKEAFSLIKTTVAAAKEKHAQLGQAQLQLVRSKLAQIEMCFYEVGLALAALRAEAVYTALGYASFEALVQTIPNLSAPTAYRLMRITEHYQESTAMRLTQSKALALLTYVEATPEADDAETLAQEDAVIGGLPISQQSVRGILEAAADVKPAEKRKKRPGEDDVRARATKLERALEPLTEEAVNVRVVHRKGAFRVMLDMPATLIDVLTKAAKKR